MNSNFLSNEHVHESNKAKLVNVTYATYPRDKLRKFIPTTISLDIFLRLIEN